MAAKKIDRMIDETYDDDEVKRAVADDVRENGTAERIERGELVLPHPDDARRWLDSKNAEEDRRRGEELRRQQARPNAARSEDVPPPPAA